MIEFPRSPDPPGAPLDKILTESNLERLQWRLQGVLSEQPTKDEVIRAILLEHENMVHYMDRHNRILEEWANVHRHGGLIDPNTGEFWIPEDWPSGDGGWTVPNEPDSYLLTGDTVYKLLYGSSIVWQYSSLPGAGQSLAIDPEGYIYVGCTSGWVVKLNPDGTKAWDYLRGTSSVSGIAVDKQGNVYTSGAGVEKLDSDGVQIWVDTGLSNYRRCSLDGEGNLYVPQGSLLYKYDPTGTLEWTNATFGSTVYDVSVDNEGFCIGVSQDSTVRKINPGGGPEWTNTDATNRLERVTVDANKVYTAGGVTGNNVVRVHSLEDGSLLETFPYSSTRGISVDPQGSIYTADNSIGGGVFKLDHDGNELWEFTGNSSVCIDFAAQPGRIGAFS